MRRNKCKKAERESEQLSKYVREWVEKVPKKITPKDITEWIQEHHGVYISPEAVGHYLRRLGYTTVRMRVNGKIRRVVVPIRE